MSWGCKILAPELLKKGSGTIAVTLIKGEELKFGSYGFDHIDLPPDRPQYGDRIKVAKIVDSTT